jgi:hypothetical protein
LTHCNASLTKRFLRPHMLTNYKKWPGLTLQQNQKRNSPLCVKMFADSLITAITADIKWRSACQFAEEFILLS